MTNEILCDIIYLKKKFKNSNLVAVAEKRKYHEVTLLKYQLSDREIAEINRILNERGNQSVKIKIENDKLTVFSVSEKLVIKK